MRVLVNISYNGRNFSGYQYQHDFRTVQGTIEKQLTSMHKTFTRIHASSRTDAGVHALEQYFHFDTQINLPPEKWKFILNNGMPKDIMINDVSIAADDFHSRFDATAKTYRYKLYTTDRNPFYDGLKTHYPYSLNIGDMKQAMNPFVATHDFTTFSSAKGEIQNKVRQILNFEVIETVDGLEFTITGTGFLYNMVRIIIAYVLEVGRGIRKPDTLNMIAAKDRTIIPKTAPAEGLYLEKVSYEKL